MTLWWWLSFLPLSQWTPLSSPSDSLRLTEQQLAVQPQLAVIAIVVVLAAAVDVLFVSSAIAVWPQQADSAVVVVVGWRMTKTLCLRTVAG